MTKIHSKFIILALFFLSACFDKKNEETWIVGVSPDNPPYEFMQDGKTVGFDLDLIQEIGKYAGKKIEIRNMELHSLLAALATNNIDLAVSALSVTSERAMKVDFSIPYYESKIAVLYRADDKFISTDDLKANLIVGAQLGSSWNLIAQELSQKNGFQISSLSSNLMLVEELKSKRIDAVILEESQVERFIEINPELAKFTIPDLDSTFAIAMPKNSPNKKIIDGAIRSLNKTEFQKIEKKWKLDKADN